MSGYDPGTVPQKRPFSLQLDLQKFEPATEEEKAQHDDAGEHHFFRDGMRRLFKTRWRCSA